VRQVARGGEGSVDLPPCVTTPRPHPRRRQRKSLGAVFDAEAFAKREAVGLKLSTGQAHFWRPLPQVLWPQKAETSASLAMVEMKADCDAESSAWCGSSPPARLPSRNPSTVRARYWVQSGPAELGCWRRSESGARRSRGRAIRAAALAGASSGIAQTVWEERSEGDGHRCGTPQWLAADTESAARR